MVSQHGRLATAKLHTQACVAAANLRGALLWLHISTIRAADEDKTYPLHPTRHLGQFC